MARLTRLGFLGLVGAVLVLVIAMGLGVLVPRPFPSGSAAVAGSPGAPLETRRILVLSNPIHTDIALPADPDVLKAFGFVADSGLELDYPGVYWIVFGWGSRAFYIETPTWGHLRAGPVLRAFTWDDSVMHVRRAGDIPQVQHTVTVLELKPQEFESLKSSIASSFEAAKDGSAIPIPGASYDSHDMFFSAHGGFNAQMGCNTWTARMLREAGYATGIWTPLPFALTASLALHNRL